MGDAESFIAMSVQGGFYSDARFSVIISIS